MTKATGNHATTDRVSKRPHKSIDRIADSAGEFVCGSVQTVTLAFE